MSPEGGDAQPAAYVPSASRASCPAEVTMVRAAGGGQQALQPPALPAVPEWRSGAAVPGEKAPARQGQPPRGRAEGGRTERLGSPSASSRPSLYCTAGRKWEGGYRHLSATRDPAQRTTLPPRGGCPPKGIGGGGLGRGAGTLHAPCRARAVGRGDLGLSEPPPQELGTQGNEQKAGSAQTSDTTLR